MIDLMNRSTNGIDVTLWFDKETDRIYLEVTGAEGDFIVRVPSDEAIRAFEHPFLYREEELVPSVWEREYGEGGDDPLALA